VPTTRTAPGLPFGVQYKTQPYDHQHRIITSSWEKDEFGLLMEVGTGKSFPILMKAVLRFLAGDIDTLFVIAPNGVHRQWINDEVPTHMPEGIKYLAAFYRAGRVNRPLQELMANRDPKVLKVVAMNVESLSHRSGLEVAQEIMRGRSVMLELDESQKVKTPGSKRTRNIWKLGREAAVRRMSTGTDTTEGLEDLYAQFRFLNPDILGCRTYAEYRHTYCIEVGQFRKIVGYRNVEALQKLIAPHVFVCEKDDCLDLPQRTYVRREVELSPEQRKHYDELRRYYLTELSGGEVLEAPLAITRLMRLQQVIAGHVPREGGWEPLPCPRVQACIDLVEDTRKKCIVWIRFRADAVLLGRAFEKAGIGFVDYNGGLSADQKSKNLFRFKNDPKVKVFLGTPAAGGTGLNINEANVAIFYSHSFSYEERHQAEARCHRIGQHHPVTYYDLVAPGTVDMKVLDALKKKGEVAKLMRDPGIFKGWLDLADA